jgi:hypothetical protein
MCFGRLSWEGCSQNNLIFNPTQINPTVMQVDPDE